MSYNYTHPAAGFQPEPGSYMHEFGDIEGTLADSDIDESKYQYWSEEEIDADDDLAEITPAEQAEQKKKDTRWAIAELDRILHTEAAKDRAAVAREADSQAEKWIAKDFTDPHGRLTLRVGDDGSFQFLEHGRWIDYEWRINCAIGADWPYGVTGHDVIDALFEIVTADDVELANAAPGDPFWHFEAGNWKHKYDNTIRLGQVLRDRNDPISLVGVWLGGFKGTDGQRGLFVNGNFYVRDGDRYCRITNKIKQALRGCLNVWTAKHSSRPITLSQAMSEMQYLCAGDALEPGVPIIDEDIEDHTARRVKGLTYQRADDVEQQPIEWLWPGRFAIGKIGGIAGAPDEGKSQITCNMAAVVSRGGSWPDGGKAKQGKIVILSAEDDAADTIAPRLEAAGADLSQCIIVNAVVQSKGGKRSFNLADDLERLTAVLASEPGVRLITIDPISAYLGSKTDAYRNTEVRAILAPLADWAARHQVAVVFVTHFNKGGKGPALGRVTDSLAFTALCRSFWLAMPEHDANGDATGRKLFLKGKFNIGKDPGGLAYRIESMSLPSGIDAPRIVWDGATTLTANDAMAAARPRKPSPTLQAAEEFLADMLIQGPVSSAEIRERAEADGHAWATVRRAKEHLHIKSEKVGKTGWNWALPDVCQDDEE